MHLHFLSRKWQRNKLKLSHVGFLYIVLFYSYKVWIHLQTCYPWLDLEGGQWGQRGPDPLLLWIHLQTYVTHDAHSLHNVINHNNAFLPPAHSLKCYSRLQLTTWIKNQEHFGDQFGLYYCSFTVIAVFADCPDADIIATDPMVNFTMPNATDANTGKPLTVSCSPMPGTKFTKNSTVVNCMASDAKGHVAPQMCSFNVQICKKITRKKESKFI